MRTRLTLLIPAVAMAATLAACGGGGPSKADFIAQADAACAPGNTAVSTTPKPTNAPQVATSAGAAATTIDGQVGALRGMKLPGGKEKDQVESLIGALAAVSAPTRSLQDAAARTDDAAMAAAALDMQAKADTAAGSAGAYGLTQCATQLKFGLGNMFDGVKNVVKASYVVKAEDACRDYYRKAAAINVQGTSAAALGRFLDQELALTLKLATDIKGLTAPPGDGTTVADMAAAMDSVNAKVADLIAAVKANNTRLAGALFDEIDVATTALNAKFDAYGLPVCGSSGP